MAFKPTTAKPDFVKFEKKLLKWWYQSGVVKKYLQRNKDAKVRFSFLDGPITANNPMGVHHAWGRTLKDCFQRYKNMRGFKQRFQNGFDNQGLWVEVEVEKELGFKDKKDIEKYGIDKFVKKCKQRTLKFAQVQTEQSKRLGYFMDWDNSYYTMSDENNYMIWHFLKKCHQNGWLYKGRDSVPWCPRCGTAISQHEILTEEYKKITHDSVFFKLPIKNRKNEYFLIWTTTPWTIPANVALAVNPDFIYGAFKKKGSDEVLIFLKDLKNKILQKEWQQIEEHQGKKLKGWRYEGPFDELPRVQKAQKENPKTFHTVVLDKDLVTATEGTGIVHLAPGAGQEDFQLGKKENLPVISAIDEGANYLAGFNHLTGKNAKNKPELIFNFLKKKDNGRFLFKIEPYTHRYPVCWRCKTELVWRVVDEWYIRMGVKQGKKGWSSRVLREKMAEVAKKIRWLPEFGLKRELDWLKNMDDWLISKKRYWGLALPIWECSCGHFEIIGSKEELKKKAVGGWQKFEGHSPHRPWVDKIKIKCPECGKLVSRAPDVGNPWLDAGIVPFSTFIDPETKKVSYMTDKKYWQEWFPADFITENFHGQFKNWFYSLIAMGTVLENKEPYRAVLAHALVRDEKGEEMHKSKGNAIEFNEAAEKMGVDVMRWVYLTQNPRINLNFGFKVGDKVRRRFHLTLWNVYNFLVTYANVVCWQPKNSLPSKPAKLDLWILTRLDQTIIKVTESLDDFNTVSAIKEIENLVHDLSTWYVRLSRGRVGPTVLDKKDQELTLSTLYTVLVVLSRTLAPFIPFLTEEIYKNLVGGKSVHLEAWPEVSNLKVLDTKLLKQMEKVRKICELGHAARKKAKIKVRQPLQLIKVKAKTILKLDGELVQLIKQELNVKEVEFTQSKDELTVELETKITPQLKAEGEVREMVRQIQELRKKAGCRLGQKIIVFGPKFPKQSKLRQFLKQKVLAVKLSPGKNLKITTA
ncbi:MAG TPA: isoleucine--tRNA ligase [Nevskiaceae bacterium]|nr:isoleucine--tRNA ligase [Nevskiaceae bacterium]